MLTKQSIAPAVSLVCKDCAKHYKFKMADGIKKPGQMWCNLHQVWVWPNTPQCESSALDSLPVATEETVDIETPRKKRRIRINPNLPKNYRQGSEKENCGLCGNGKRFKYESGFSRISCHKYNYAFVACSKVCNAFKK